MSNETEVLPPVRVLGVGSPFDLDQIGWRLLEALQQSPRLKPYLDEQLMLEVVDRPGVNLLRYFDQAQYVLLLDAVLDDDCPVGEAKRYSLDEIRRSGQLQSSHGFGVQEALSLAETLGQLPKRLEIIGISVGSDGENTKIDWDVTILQLAASLESEIGHICGAIFSKSVTY